MSTFILLAKSNNTKLYHLYFGDYYNYFKQSFEKHQFIIVPFKKTLWLNKLVLTTISISFKLLFRLKSKHIFGFTIVDNRGYTDDIDIISVNDIVNKYHSKRFIFTGWLFKFNNRTEKDDILIRSIFAPGRNFLLEVDKFVMSYMFDKKINLAIHIRRGDYINFKGGQFYYNDETYARVIKNFIKIHGLEASEYNVVIFSNENCSLSVNNLNIICERRSEIVDLYLMSRCDFIIGPPSTFSMWASFYGSKPLWFIENSDAEISSMSEFKVF
jgi:hypothetical protein